LAIGPCHHDPDRRLSDDLDRLAEQFDAERKQFRSEVGDEAEAPEP
jgi:hypothetical protein